MKSDCDVCRNTIAAGCLSFGQWAEIAFSEPGHSRHAHDATESEVRLMWVRVAEPEVRGSLQACILSGSRPADASLTNARLNERLLA